MILKLPIIVFVCIYLESVSSLYCYWNTGCPYTYLSSKTPYNLIRGDIRDTYKSTGCDPVSLWAIVRHGKRNPGLEYGRNMRNAIVIRDHVIASHESGNSSLCAQDIDILRKWQIDNEMFEKIHQLAAEGYQESVGIASRLKQAFPKLLGNLRQGDYTFRPAFGKWMEDSAKGFVEGLKDDNLVIENAKLEYDIMDPYTTCGKYQRDVKKNQEVYAEAAKYKESSEYLAMKDRIHRRLGISYVLSNENITALYDLCRYTWSGIDFKYSPWCALFTNEDLQVLEYYGDVRHYYRNGYGTPMNAKFGQIAMADLLKTFQDFKNGSEKRVTTYFSHATMMDMIYTSLGLFKDDSPLTGAYRDPDRKWRTSKISTFSANLIAVLNRCNGNSTDDYNVVFYLNEEPLIFMCKEGVCKWQEFEEMLTPFLNTTTDFCEFKSVPYI